MRDEHFVIELDRDLEQVRSFAGRAEIEAVRLAGEQQLARRLLIGHLLEHIARRISKNSARLGNSLLVSFVSALILSHMLFPSRAERNGELVRAHMNLTKSVAPQQMPQHMRSNGRTTNCFLA